MFSGAYCAAAKLLPMLAGASSRLRFALFRFSEEKLQHRRPNKADFPYETAFFSSSIALAAGK